MCVGGGGLKKILSLCIHFTLESGVPLSKSTLTYIDRFAEWLPKYPSKHHDKLKACLHRLCNLFATGSRLEKKLKSRSGCKGRGKVFLESPTSRRLKSVASCLLNMHKRLAATEFDREEVA